MLLTTLCYLCRGDEVLLLHRQKKTADISKGKYMGLGGKVDPGESPRACAIREVQEESGFLMGNPILRGTIYFPQFSQQDELMFIYTADEFSGEECDCAEGTLHWIPRKDMQNYPMWEGDRTFLPWVFGDRFFEAIFRYDQNMQFVGHEVAFAE
jgi:8-oxo-dGTP diphosphatase